MCPTVGHYWLATASEASLPPVASTAGSEDSLNGAEGSAGTRRSSARFDDGGIWWGSGYRIHLTTERLVCRQKKKKNITGKASKTTHVNTIRNCEKRTTYRTAVEDLKTRRLSRKKGRQQCWFELAMHILHTKGIHAFIRASRRIHHPTPNAQTKHQGRQNNSIRRRKQWFL